MLKDFFKIAIVKKKHGYDGTFMLEFDRDFPINRIENIIKQKEAVFVFKDGIPVPFFISVNSLIITDNYHALLKFDDIDDDVHAKELLNELVFLPNKYKQKQYKTNTPLAWLGFKVIDKKFGYLGKITDYMDIPANPLLVVKYNNQEMLIPIHKEFLIEIDENQSIIRTSLPSGFLDLF